MGLEQMIADIENPSDVPQIQQEWPPPEHRTRVGNYVTFQQVFDGNHLDAFGDRDELERYNVYIACNIGALVSRVSTDLLFGEEIDFEFPDDTPDEKQAAVLAFWKENHLQQKMYEAALDGAALGDCVFEVSRDGDKNVDINPMPVDMWFPVASPDNQREIRAHVFAWERTISGPRGAEIDLVKMRIHLKGSIENKLWILDGGKLKREVLPGDGMWDMVMVGLEPSVPTEIEDFLVSHVPNFRTSRDYFGRSDYRGVMDIFSALNARLTQYDYVLTHHAEPHIKVPPGVLDENGEVDRKDLEIVEITDKETDVYGYITYDAKLDDSARIIKELTEKALMLTDTDKTSIGIVDGNGPISGRALKLSQTRTLSKVRRRQVYFSQAIPDLLVLAQRLMGDKDPVRPIIVWGDGLPSDPLEDAEYVAARILAGTMDAADGIMYHDDVDRERAEQKVLEIEEGDSTNVENVVPGRAVPAQIPAPVLGDVGALDNDGDR